MNCTEIKKLLVEYAEGLLEASQMKSISDHLERCPACRQEADSIRSLQTRLIEDNKAAAQTQIEEKVIYQILREQNARIKASSQNTLILAMKSLVVNRFVLRIAAAAVIILAIFMGLNSLQSKVTYARAAEPILTAQTLIYDVGNSTDVFRSHDIVVGRFIRRVMPLYKNEVIIDLDDSRLLSLDPIHKNAMYLKVDLSSAYNVRDFVTLIRNVIAKAIKSPRSAVVELGRLTIDSQDVIGFKFGPEEDGTEVTIWADPVTALPIQIECKSKNWNREFGNFTIRNIKLNAPVDESQVSMDVPPGYTLQNEQVFLVEIFESDFIELLAKWTQNSPDGVFPDTLNSHDFMTQGIISPLVFVGMQITDILTKCGAEWEYSGEGVQAGDPNKIVFRYRLPGSPSWRIIYGDLRTENVPA